MEFIPFDNLPEIQQKVIQFKLDEPLLTWNEWRNKCSQELNLNFTPQKLGRFVKKTALGMPWDPESDGGRNPYLCPTDLELLKIQATDRCHSGTNFIEIDDFLEIASEIKVSRLIAGNHFLKFINSQKFAECFHGEEEVEPSRQWINSTIKEIGLSLEYPAALEEERFHASSKNLIRSFYSLFRPLIEACPPQLLFGADETMLKSIMRTKVLTDSQNDNLLRKVSDIPHITGMCCHTVTGVSVPPFIILPNSLQNLPAELNEFENDSLAWFASSKCGWINKDLFLVWTTNFLNWLSVYRRKLPQSIRFARALLVVDGHSSRECPLALEMLSKNLVDVLVLPAHSTHITQMFDVGLAATLKKNYAKNMKKILSERELIGEEASRIAKLRYAAVASFITSWQSVCTYKMCSMAARVTGWFPFDENAAASSRFAEERTEEQDGEYIRKRAERKRLDINARLINTEDFIRKIQDSIKNCGHFKQVCGRIPDGITWFEFCRTICKKQLPNASYFLSRIHCYVSSNSHLICFD